MAGIPDTESDIELVFDILASNPLSENDKDTAEYLEFTYSKDTKKGHEIIIYNPKTEQETILIEKRG